MAYWTATRHCLCDCRGEVAPNSWEGREGVEFWWLVEEKGSECCTASVAAVSSRTEEKKKERRWRVREVSRWSGAIFVEAMSWGWDNTDFVHAPPLQRQQNKKKRAIYTPFVGCTQCWPPQCVCALTSEASSGIPLNALGPSWVGWVLEPGCTSLYISGNLGPAW